MWFGVYVDTSGPNLCFTSEPQPDLDCFYSTEFQLPVLLLNPEGSCSDGSPDWSSSF